MELDIDKDGDIDAHMRKDGFSEEIFYPTHPPREASKTFRKTKIVGSKNKLPCAISGHTEGVEYHHVFTEWAFTNAIDWEMVKKIGTGEITRLPVLDLVTHQPLASGETFDVKHSLIWAICKIAELRGFKWDTFDPANPEMFVDSIFNMLVLHEKFHRAKNHGIHEMSFPVWIYQAMPRKNDFIFSLDEVVDKSILK